MIDKKDYKYKNFQEVVYKVVDGIKLMLDIYIPEIKSAKYPVSVFLHGGGWETGTNITLRVDSVWEKILSSLLEEGYIVVSVEYRFTNDNVKFPAHLEDCKDSIRWLRKNKDKYSIDSKNINVWGASAGGHLALMVGLTPDNSFVGDEELVKYSSKVTSIVSWFGPTDFVSWIKENKLEMVYDVLCRFLNGSIEENEDNYINASPIEYYNIQSPPVLLIHGEDDDVVPISQSIELYKYGKKIGTEIDLLQVKKAKHSTISFDKENNNPMFHETLDTMINFINKYNCN